MTLPRPADAALRITMVAVVVVRWLPFVTVGRQPYRPGSFASRIGELEDLSVIEGSWARPAQLALVATVIGAVATLSWGRWQRPLTFACATVGLVAAALGYLLASESSLLSASSGMALLLGASSFGLVVMAATRSDRTAFVNLGRSHSVA